MLEVKPIIEALLFLCGDGLDLPSIISITEEKEDIVESALDCLVEEYSHASRGVILIKMGQRYQFRTKSEYENYMAKLQPFKQRQGLSRAALETLAIISHHQPITKSKIEHIRGVNSDSSVLKLLERELIEEAGRLEAPGKPVLYKTTDEFLKNFGLESCEQLINEAEVI